MDSCNEQVTNEVRKKGRLIFACSALFSLFFLLVAGSVIFSGTPWLRLLFCPPQVKCDKVRPMCGRCSRLGLSCGSQARGRGRPPNSARGAASTAAPAAASSCGGTVDNAALLRSLAKAQGGEDNSAPPSSSPQSSSSLSLSSSSASSSSLSSSASSSASPSSAYLGVPLSALAAYLPVSYGGTFQGGGGGDGSADATKGLLALARAATGPIRTATASSSTGDQAGPEAAVVAPLEPTPPQQAQPEDENGENGGASAKRAKTKEAFI